MKRFVLVSLALVALSAAKPVSTAVKTVSGDWVSIFDGKTTHGWHTYGQSTAGSAWKAADGVLHLDASSRDGRGDLVTDGEYDNFDLKLEWKESKGANSGIMFDVHEDPSKYQNTYETGPEMQILDNDNHPDGKNFKHRAGDLYDLIPCKVQTVKPVGEWNKVEIRLRNGKLQFFLNDTEVVATRMWTDDWNKLVAGSKFAKMPGFATFHKGHISLQDHGGDEDVWFRDIQIKQL
ncbi:3-keto-disaccharide hydrolase [Dinghuibacter silviterrae]|uniref:Uncharacterized protein DUF1080 n=1 Tax=Dinghuibacter silviterrae TaxID=1539049 RepID=A0A4R8DNM8_9BACT|nr:DUF1080 domain-containing protein [Dinghuibacter silviterrae]TDW99623.1 uncharacterized protein DUF1080 [Dinghuibacter silviterrae]